MIFNSTRDVEMRLDKTIVREACSGEPVLVSGVESIDEIYVKFLHNYDEMSVPMLLEDLDLTPVPLGGINTRARSKYIARQPFRRQSQGLDLASVVQFGPGGGTIDLYHCPKALRKCILGEYPDLPESLEKLATGEKDSVSVHRNILLSAAGRLYYKGIWVGTFKKPEFNFKIRDRFLFLEEELQETLNEIH